MTEQQRLANALGALGSTEDEVYEKLLAEGCFGDPTEGTTCPVARNLARLYTALYTRT